LEKACTDFAVAAGETVAVGIVIVFAAAGVNAWARALFNARHEAIVAGTLFLVAIAIGIGFAVGAAHEEKER
jgi:hypothetical protein